MDKLSLEQINKERHNGKLMVVLSILKSEIAKMNRIGFAITNNETISRWSGISLKEVKQLREICYMLNPDNIVYDVAVDEPETPLTEEAAEKLLIDSVFARVNEILETYPYPLDVIAHVIPFELCADGNKLSENAVDHASIDEYSKKLYLGHKALFDYYSEKALA